MKIINYLILLIKRRCSQIQFIRHNYKHNHKNLNNTKFDKKIILVEQHHWQPLHISFYYLINYFYKKYDCKIIAYPGHILISEKIFFNFYKKIQWFLGNFLKINTFGIYYSLGVYKIIFPKISNDIKIKSHKIFNSIEKKIVQKSDVLNINIDGVEIGDLIYDTFLKLYKLPTIDVLDKKFKKFLWEVINYFYYWDDFFLKNDVKVLIGSHSVYTIAIPIRIAIKKNIKVYIPHISALYKLDKNYPLADTEFLHFKKNFSTLTENDKKIGIEEAKRRIDLRIQGKVGVDMWYSTKTSFGPIKERNVLKKNDKIKVLIATHCFFDAPNAIGKLLFVDFYEWLLFLGNFSKNTDYDWYIKTHPDFIPESYSLITDFLKKFPHISLIPSDISHHQLKKEGINFALTCYGTIGFEYALLGIPVINASANNPHINYNFNLHPKNIDEYNFLLKNLKDLKININFSEIYEYYFMMHIYHSKNWIFENLAKVEETLGGFKKLFNDKIYDLWLEEFTREKHENIMSYIENFIAYDRYKINYLDIKANLADEIKKGRNIY